MSLDPKITVREFDKFRDVSGYPAVAVVNPDGTNIGGSSGNATIAIGSSATLFAVVNTGAAGIQNSMVTLFSGPNQIGSVTISNTPNVVVTSLPTISIGNTINTLLTGNVTLNPSPNFIGLATVVNGNQPALIASSAFIGLISAASINGRVEITNISAGVTVFQGTNPFNSLGTTTLGAMLPTGTNFIGLATVVLSRSPILGAGDTTALFASTATGSMLNTSLMGRTGNVAGVEASGRLLSAVTLYPSPNFIGLVTTVPGSNLTLNASNAFIGLATVVIGTGSSFIGGVSVYGNLSASLGGNVTLNPSPNFIGLVTVANIVSVYQSAPSALMSLVSANTAITQLLPSNTLRRGGSVYNNSSSILYYHHGVSASSIRYKAQLAANTYYEIPAGYSGIVQGFWVTQAGSAAVVEES